MKGLYIKETIEFVKKVTQGNPGAFTVQEKLQYFGKWPHIMRWLLKNNYTGGKLWELYKDKFNQDGLKLGYWIIEKITIEEEELYLKSDNHPGMDWKW